MSRIVWRRAYAVDISPRCHTCLYGNVCLAWLPHCATVASVLPRLNKVIYQIDGTQQIKSFELHLVRSSHFPPATPACIVCELISVRLHGVGWGRVMAVGGRVEEGSADIDGDKTTNEKNRM